MRMKNKRKEEEPEHASGKVMMKACLNHRFFVAVVSNVINYIATQNPDGEGKPSPSPSFAPLLQAAMLFSSCGVSC
ncbi:hypothetical protein DPQ26_12915 [Bacillus sp. E25]|nr:hypothetical protein DOS87_13150 [Bacillus sp. CR71]AXR22698.1 hypothetical protein DPQ26_12915 [Bacillus sp. E25]